MSFPSDLLFERQWSLQLIPPLVSAVQTSRYAIVFSSGSAGAPLRLQFSCERSLMSDPNKGKITLTNLSTSTASLLQAGTLVILKAGYVSNNALIYKGQLVRAETSREGAETDTVLECGDGEPYVALSHVQLSYKGKVKLAQVIQDIGAKLKVTIGGQVYESKGVIVQGLPDQTFVNLTISSLLRDALDGLLHPFGMSWSIQSGVLLIQNDKGILSLRATRLTPANGLVGQVSRTDMGMKCECLMIPQVAPGNAISLAGVGKPLNGNYRVVKATYKGDTMGQDWGIDIEAQSLVAPLAVAPTATKSDDINNAVSESASTSEDNFDGADG